MNNAFKQIKLGDTVVTPAGRLLAVKDIVVPRNARAIQPSIPAQFRNSARKIVIFENNTVATLAEVNSLYKVVEDTLH